MSNIDLKRRKAIVTGGAQGIGKAIALKLAGAGADILLADKLQTARFYLAALEMIDQAESLGLQARATAASLLGWTQPTDVLYSKALAHRGRCLQTFDPHRWGSWQWAEEEFIKLERREPGNRYSGYYLYGDLTGWHVKDYRRGTEGAPRRMTGESR